MIVEIQVPSFPDDSDMIIVRLSRTGSGAIFIENGDDKIVFSKEYAQMVSEAIMKIAGGIK